MPKPRFPWAAGAYGVPYWRSRHVFSGDLIPPSYPAGPASGTTRVPYQESGPVTPDGSYAPTARALGLHEPVASPVVNRGLYALAEQLDMLREKDDAVPALTGEPNVQVLVGPPYEVNLSAWGEPPLVYLGPYGTMLPGVSPYSYCGSYIKLWDFDTIGPLYGVGSGTPLSVTDVTSAPAGGVSLYTALPTEAQVYPRGAPGELATVMLTGITFTGAGGGTAPDGTPAAPLTVVCFFNYSFWERLVHDGLAETPAFAICTTSVAGAPDTYTLNRDVEALGWVAGDYVYTTHFAWGPTLNLSDPLALTDVRLVYHTFASAGFGPTQRFASLLRLMGAPLLDVPLTMWDPVGGTQYSWDRLNALFRADDLTAGMVGSVGFDHQTGDAVRPYAGFMHRTRLAFANAGTTMLAVGEPCTFNQPARLVTLVGLPGVAQFHGAAQASTHLIPGVDLIELESAAGERAVFVLELMASQSTCTVRCLDGSDPAVQPAFPVFTALTVYRPTFRSGGGFDEGAVQAGYPDFSHLVGVGGAQALPLTGIPALTLFSGGARYPLKVFGYPGDEPGGSGTGLGPVFGVGVDLTGTPPAYAFFEYGAHGVGEYFGPAVPDSAMHRVVAQKDTIAVNVERTRSRLVPLHTWDEDPEFVHEVRSASGWPNQVDRASFRISPNAAAGTPFGLSKTGVAADIPYTAELYLGDPGTAPTVPNYGRVVAGPLGGVGTRLYCGLVAHRDGEAADDRVAWIVEGAPANGGPAVPDRFQINSDMEFAWDAPRVFYHQVVLADGLDYAINPAGTPWRLHTDAPISQAGAEYVRWWMGDGVANGPDAVEFPLNLPQGAVIQSALVLYYRDNWIAGAASRAFQAELYQQEAVWAAPAAPTKTLLGSGVATMGALWEAVIVPAAPTTVDNAANQYWVRICSAYDENGGGLANQEVAAIRVTYTLQDFRPA